MKKILAVLLAVIVLTSSFLCLIPSRPALAADPIDGGSDYDSAVLIDHSPAQIWASPNGVGKFYKIIPTQSTTYTIQSQTGTCDPYAMLFDSSHGILADGDDYLDLNFYITYELTAFNTYYLAVLTYDTDTVIQLDITGGGLMSKTPVVTDQPDNKTVTVGATSSFSVSAESLTTVNYQWQVSTDGGSSWANVTEGIGTSYIYITPATTMAMSGYQYRCLLTNSDESATSDAATLTVNKIIPTIVTPPAASGIYYGQTLDDSTLSGGSASVPGSFSWTNSGIEPAVSDSGVTQYSVTFTPSDTTNYSTATTTVTLSVCKATPAINTPPDASGITVGQSLASSTLSGGSASVPGSFSWTNSAITPALSDSNVTPYAVTFTPSDSDNYNNAATTVTLSVGKVTPVIVTPPIASGITYGQSLANSTLSGGSASVPGSFSWTNSAVTPAVSDSGTTPYSVTFTPSDTTNYSAATTSVTLSVGKATPAINTAPTASSIAYGQSLADSTLSGGSASVSGSFSWTNSGIEPAVSDSGVTLYSVTFTPSDTANYNTATTTVVLTVNKAAPTITSAPSASAITYGDSLADSTLSGGSASVSGSFSWTSSSTEPSVSDSGTTPYSVTFTPTDSMNYSTATTSVTLTIGKATPTISAAPTASSIYYGQSLASSTLTGGSASVTGIFTWTDNAITPEVSDSDVTPYSVTFTPADIVNYSTATTTVTLAVNKPAPEITAVPTASAITYGDSLADSILSGGSASVPGSFSWTNTAITPAVSDSGTTPYSVTFTPTDTTNYSAATTTVTLIVGKATSAIIAPPAASGIRYGQSLSNSTLTGGSASVPGSFSWTNSTLTPAMSDSNVTPYSVTFTPDSANYSTVTTTVTLTVSKATPTIPTVPTASAITYGQSLADSALTGGSASVPGSFSWTNSAITPAVSDSGVTRYTVTFTPNDSMNYNNVTTTVTLAVSKATPTIPTVPTASAITYGQSLADSALTEGSASVPGSFSWSNSAITPAVSDSGVTRYTVTFTPNDSMNYNSVTTTVTLTVSKATPKISAAPTASAITYGEALSYSVLTGGSASVPGRFSWTSDSIVPTVSDSGITPYSVSFTPTDSANYTAITTAVSLTISKAAYDMGGVSFNNRSFTYSGTARSLAVSGTLPAGVSVSYSGNGKISPGTYTVTASFTGDAKNYLPIPDMTATLTIRSAASSEPDSTPTPTPSVSPSLSAAAEPDSGAAPEHAPAPTPTPTSTPAPAPTAPVGQVLSIAPHEIERNEQSGLLTLVIDISVLPEGTESVQLPDGRIVEIDESAATFTVEVRQADLNNDETVTLVSLSSEGIPLATMAVQIPATAVSSFPAVFIWILAGIIAAAVIVILFVVKKKSKK